MSKSFGIYVLVFFVFLAWFVLANPWYPQAKLLISGAMKEPGKVIVWWDSGSGLNGYEQKQFTLQTLPEKKDGLCQISVKKVMFDRDDSVSSQVLLMELLVDGASVPFSSFTRSGNVGQDKNLLILEGKKSNVQVSVKPQQHVKLQFLKYNYAGQADVEVCGKVTREDFYNSNNLNKWSWENTLIIDYWYLTPEGKFTLSLDLPRYPIQAFLIRGNETMSIDSFQIEDEFGTVLKVAESIHSPFGTVYQTDQIDRERARYFHPQRFALQILFTGVSTFILICVFRYLKHFKSLRDVFFNEGRFFFWIMFFSSAGLFFIYHYSFWPGIASTDSLKIWRAAHIPGMYLGDHPLLNVIFYQYIMFFWDNMAVVPLTQNLLCSLLIAYLFFSFHRWGVSRLITTIFFLFTLFSLPIGLYNAVLWKDVPFAFISVLLAIKVADLYFLSRFQRENITITHWVYPTILTILAIGFRFNGIVYLLSIPALILVLGIIKVRWRRLFAMVTLVMLGGVIVVVFDPLPEYLVTQSTNYTKQAYSKVSLGFFAEKLEEYGGILDVRQTNQQWDDLHLTFYGRYNNDFLKETKWSDVYPYLPLGNSRFQKAITGYMVKIYKRSYQSPLVYLTWNPFYLLYLLLILPFFIKWLPMSAVFSTVILSQVMALVILDIFNWRYYYFAYFGLYILIPLIFADIARKRLIEANEQCKLV